MTAPFEVLRFTAAPATDDVAVVELTGRFAGPTDGRPVRLLVERGSGRRLELPAATTGQDGDRWRATFAVPLALTQGASYALSLRGLVLDLPAPDETDDRFASMARELNRQRRAVEAAEARADAAAEEAASRADARVGAAEAEANAARSAFANLERRAEEAEARAVAAREETARVQAEGEAERQAALGAIVELERALEAGRDEAGELRRALKTTRAELEAARREAAAAAEREDRVTAELARTSAVRPHAVAVEPDEIDEEVEDDDEETGERPTAIVRRRRPDPPTVHQEPVPAGEPVERVRVLGRPARAPDPAAPPTPVDAPPLDPASRTTAALVVVLLVLLALVVLVLLLG